MSDPSSVDNSSTGSCGTNAVFCYKHVKHEHISTAQLNKQKTYF